MEDTVFEVPLPGITDAFLERFVTLKAAVPVSLGLSPYFFTRDSILFIAFVAF